MKVNEIFYSIQGEGIHSGLPTIFIRLTGCNLRCKWCDTQYAYDEGDEMTITEIIAKLTTYPSKLICITGGEPLAQTGPNELIGELLELGYYINIETNGSINIQNLLTKYNEILISLDIKCPSSEMENQMDLTNIELLKATDQLKFVIQDLNDYDHALKILREHHPDCHIIFTPLEGIELKWLAEKVLEDQSLFEELGIKIRVLPQLHKLIWGDARGI